MARGGAVMSAGARWPRVALSVALMGAALFAVPRRAHACGASGGGAAGLSGCSLEAHEEATRPKLRLGLSGAFTSTVLSFSPGSERVTQERWVYLAQVERRPTPRTAIQFAAGGLVSGELLARGNRYVLSPGPVLGLAASQRVLDPDGAVPFVLIGAQLTGLSSRSSGPGPNPESATYAALDLRVGGTVGWVLSRSFAPYTYARVFGGPIAWRLAGQDLIGTDKYKYQVGAGLSVSVLKRLDFFAEGTALGERGISAGAGVLF